MSPNCSLAFVPYKADNTVPAAALKLGYLTGVGPTYSIRVQRPDLNTDKFGVVAASELDILVQV